MIAGSITGYRYGRPREAREAGVGPRGNAAVPPHRFGNLSDYHVVILTNATAVSIEILADVTIDFKPTIRGSQARLAVDANR